MRKVCPWPEQQGCKQTTWELLQFSTWRKNLYLVEKGRPAASIMAWISIRVVFVDYFSNGKRRRGRRKVRKRAMPATRLRRTDGRMRGAQASRVRTGRALSGRVPVPLVDVMTWHMRGLTSKYFKLAIKCILCKMYIMQNVFSRDFRKKILLLLDIPSPERMQ